MAENEATIVIVPKDDDEGNSKKPNPNPIISFFSNFLQSFNFPPPKKVETAKFEATVLPKVTKTAASVEKVETAKFEATVLPKAKTAGSVEAMEESMPVTVKLPETPPAVEPLKLEAEELKEDTNPVVLWQVYAIGGFFVLRWALARWKERRANRPPPPNEPSNEDPPSDE